MNSLASSASLVGRPDRLARRAARTAPSARSPAAVVVRADDLRQRVELLEGVALGDPLRAERDVDAAAALGEVLGHVLGRARVDGAAQDDQRAVAEVRRDLVDGPLEDRHRRAEELVDRRADDDDERRRSRSIIEPSAPKLAAGRSARTSRSSSSRAGLQERHLAGARCGRASPGSCRRCRPAGRPSRRRGSAAGRHGRRRRGRRHRGRQVERSCGRF